MRNSLLLIMFVAACSPIANPGGGTGGGGGGTSYDAGLSCSNAYVCVPLACDFFGAWQVHFDAGFVPRMGSSCQPDIAPDHGPLFDHFVVINDSGTACFSGVDAVITDGGCGLTLVHSCRPGGFDPGNSFQRLDLTLALDAGTASGSWYLSTQQFSVGMSPCERTHDVSATL